MADQVEYVVGGQVYFDGRNQEWVALSYVRVLGRFKTKAEAVAAVKAEAERTRGLP